MEKMEKKKVLVAVFVTLMMVFTAFIPVSKIVWAAGQDSLQITFRFVGNKSVDISLASWNFTTVWAGGMKNTTLSTQFSVWNNGTAVVTLQAAITGIPTGLALKPHDHPPTGIDTYALYGLKGTIQYTPWYNITYQTLETKLNKTQPRTFGLRLYAGNVSGSNNATWKMMNITYMAL
jgi:hypothetical protein